jgi:hypothetical protein
VALAFVQFRQFEPQVPYLLANANHNDLTRNKTIKNQFSQIAKNNNYSATTNILDY